MFCENCGSELPEGALFCNECGSRQNQTEVPQQETAGIEVQEPVKKAGQPATAGHKSRVLSVIFSILIVLAGISVGLILMVRSALSESAVDNLVNDLDFAELEVGFMEDADRSETLPELLVDVVQDNYMGRKSKKDIEKDMEKLLNKKFVKKFVSKKLNAYVEDLFHETGDGVIETEELEDLLVDNIDEIYELTGFTLNEMEINYILAEMEKDDALEATDLSKYRRKSPVTFFLIKNMFSYWMAAIWVILSILFTAGVFLVQNEKRKGLSQMGINLTVIGIIDFILGICTGLTASILNSNINLGMNFWKALFAPAMRMGIIVGIIFAVVGIILYMIYIITGKTGSQKIAKRF